ncbi:prevent-host-death family protein [Saccharopolyspora phatthalungensis]|uniref:PHD/YefM family antitoxin component YafN of YafNO toxin-antitoxin module n=1 Tax=Saccharopolyspora phatthalungensis TaxID=664693 RepID=A0A840PWA9_9PSEU|nr:prevent-host-death family protein [Saccharopolyspora phatthalungensis]MBB5154562.1 PHD/YefM family antitoxin component YafN of YafNO toxin-antitoxin module [Saccharopolyspora phatthalungensis]
MKIELSNTRTITEAAKAGVSRLVADARDSNEPIVLMSNSRAVAGVVNLRRLERLQHLEEAESDLRLLALAFSRMFTDTGERITLDSMLAKAGIDRADLDDIECEDEAEV